MNKAQEIRDQDAFEIEADLGELRQELFRLRNQKKLTRKMDQPHLFRKLRGDIARRLTILKEKSTQQSQEG